MVVVALALGSAVAFGAADFWGGLASRRAPATAVVAAVQTASLAVLLTGLLIWPSSTSAADIGWGAASGLAGVIGVLLLYKGLAEGRMSVVAPLTGLTAAALPVLYSPLVGEVPGTLPLLGIVVALAAIVLVSREPSSAAGEEWALSTAGMVKIGLASGVGFGVLFILLDQTDAASGIWPLVANKVVAILVVAVQATLVSRTGLRTPPAAWPVMAACAVAGTAAEVLYLLSTQRGLVAIAAVLTSLYPASTVVLARFVLHERLRPDQLAGFGLAGIAVVLIAVGSS